MEIKLTGKCKKDFEKWLSKGIGRTTIYYYEVWNSQFDGEIDIEDVWDNLPQSMQYGVLVDFFDNVGIRIEVSIAEYTEPITYVAWVNTDWIDSCENRSQARQKAIEKANELYNEKHK